ncbi:MAG: cupin domain-containing protein [Gammaproteobacteria bacterium]|nr:cupin domain-containing protein [Gammaproteobacteria bacterium]MDH5729503.1 cupin domain-containing protein [Gammaproteobacteria bacterium]
MNPRDLLLTAAQIQDMQGELKTHFQNPNAVRINKSLGDAVGLKNIGVHLIQVAPGKDSTEYHIHHHEEECVYVLQGKATAIIDQEEFRLNPGDFLGFPASTAAHNIINDGEDDLICLVMGQRLPFDVGDYPNKKQRIYRFNGEWNVVDWHQIIKPKS